MELKELLWIYYFDYYLYDLLIVVVKFDNFLGLLFENLFFCVLIISIIVFVDLVFKRY